MCTSLISWERVTWYCGIVWYPPSLLYHKLSCQWLLADYLIGTGIYRLCFSLVIIEPCLEVCQNMWRSVKFAIIDFHTSPHILTHVYAWPCVQFQVLHISLLWKLNYQSVFFIIETTCNSIMRVVLRKLHFYEIVIQKESIFVNIKKVQNIVVLNLIPVKHHKYCANPKP